MNWFDEVFCFVRVSPMGMVHLKAVRLAAVTFSTVILASCGQRKDQAAWWQGEQQRIEVSHQLELANLRYERLSPHQVGELEKLREEIIRQGDTLVALKARSSLLKQEIQSLELQRAEFQKSVLRDRRQRVLGMKFEKYPLNSGRVFEDVSVTSIDDAGVSIRHTDGSARLRFSDLDSAQRAFFGLEEQLAVAAEKQEAVAAAAYERWIDKQMTEVSREEERTAAIAKREIPQVSRTQVTSADVRPLAQQATHFGSSSYRYSRYRTYYRTYRPNYVYYPNPVYSTSQPRAFIPAARVSGSRCEIPPAPQPKTCFADTTLLSIP